MMNLSDPAIVWFYIAVALQISVTTVFVPLKIKSQFSKYLSFYTEEDHPALYTSSSKVIDYALRFYLLMSISIAVVSFYFLYSSFTNKQELFNWDNQSGIMVLFVMSLLPLFFLIFVNKRYFKLLKDHASKKRTASLVIRRWQDFIPKFSIALLVLGHILFVSVNQYFQQQPFDGFAGYVNYLGVIFLDTVNLVVISLIIKGKNLSQVNGEDKKRIFQARAIKINVTIWIIAIYYLVIALLLAGAELRDYALVIQSLYFVLIYVMVNKLFVSSSDVTPPHPTV